MLKDELLENMIKRFNETAESMDMVTKTRFNIVIDELKNCKRVSSNLYDNVIYLLQSTQILNRKKVN